MPDQAAPRTHVLVPKPLQPSVGGANTLVVDGATVQEVLTSLSHRFPPLADKLFDADGVVRRSVNVLVNGEDCRFLDGMSTAVTDMDEVELYLAISGG